MKHYYKTGIKLSAAAITAALIVYYLQFAPIKTEAIEVGSGTIVAEAMGTGTLEARVRASISPKISGRIEEVLVDQSDKVVKGQKLFTMDDKDLYQQVDMAKADMAAAQASVEKAAAQIKSSEATEIETKSFFNRMSQLVPSGAVSMDALDKAKQQMDIAQATLTHSQSAKIEAEKFLAKAQATLKYHQERLADTVISSPFDGLIVARRRDAGDIVVPGSKVLDIVSLDELWVSAWVDETLLNQLQDGQASTIVFRSAPKVRLPGKVARISPQADSETREVLVDVTVDRMPEIWAIGQRAEVYIETARKENAVIIPQNVIVWRQGQPGVFVIEDGKAYWRKITTGLEGKENIEVSEGLQAGQMVLVPGVKLPKDGRAVKVTTK